MFQIHCAVPAIAEAAHSLRKVLEEYEIFLDTVHKGNPQEDPLMALANHSEDWEQYIQKIKEAGEEFEGSLRTIEFPEQLPHITTRLIFASIVAQEFHLSFEVVDYKLEVIEDGEFYSWLVMGRVINKYGRGNERSGISFGFRKDSSSIVEGALLSACADAFVECMFSAIPHFPKGRWDFYTKPS